jgi:cytoskeleton protein RodZ
MNDAGDIRAAAPGAGMPPNERLAQARQAQGLSTGEVARQLKLSVWQVEALESGQYQQLPGPIFVRGFIRNYARLLKLDPEELVHAVTDSLPAAAELADSPQARDIPFPSGGPRRWVRYAAGVAVVVVLLAVYEFYFNKEPATVATEVPPAATPPVKEPQAAAPAKPTREASAKTSREAQTKPPATAPAPTPQVAAVAPAAASAPQPRERVAHPDDRELRFVFDEESWVEVRDRNDQTIFSQLNRAGTTRRIVGLPPLQIVVGNSQGVRMTFDGREIDLARHTKIDVARLTVP